MLSDEFYNISGPLAAKAHAFPAMALLCLLLLFIQGVDLIHSHNGDLQRQIDCDICLKIDSGSDAAAVSSSVLALNLSGQVYLEAFSALPFLAIPSANSRAPPRV
ncbi:MAG: hypothetical protein O2971_17715 [Proteobacteria bacterium]|nr:hypothetical protein [Pseudomonadota bacterium]